MTVIRHERAVVGVGRLAEDRAADRRVVVDDRRNGATGPQKPHLHHVAARHAAPLDRAAEHGATRRHAVRDQAVGQNGLVCGRDAGRVHQGTPVNVLRIVVVRVVVACVTVAQGEPLEAAIGVRHRADATDRSRAEAVVVGDHRRRIGRTRDERVRRTLHGFHAEQFFRAHVDAVRAVPLGPALRVVTSVREDEPVRRARNGLLERTKRSRLRAVVRIVAGHGVDMDDRPELRLDRPEGVVRRDQMDRIIRQRPIVDSRNMEVDESARRGVRHDAELDCVRPVLPQEPRAETDRERLAVHRHGFARRGQTDGEPASPHGGDILHGAAVDRAVRRARIAEIIRVAVRCWNLRKPIRRTCREGLRARIQPVVALKRRPDLGLSPDLRHGTAVARHRARVRHAVEHDRLRQSLAAVVLADAVVDA